MLCAYLFVDMMRIDVDDDNNDEEMEMGGGNGVMGLLWKNVTKNILTVIHVLYQFYLEKNSIPIVSQKANPKILMAFKDQKRQVTFTIYIIWLFELSVEY